MFFTQGRLKERRRAHVMAVSSHCYTIFVKVCLVPMSTTRRVLHMHTLCTTQAEVSDCLFLILLLYDPPDICHANYMAQHSHFPVRCLFSLGVFLG